MKLVRMFVHIVLYAVIVTALSPIIVAQDLPVGDPRNDLFRDHFQAVVKANPNITDFEKMVPGQEYNLPDRSIDKLELGDTFGIWGREFGKIYGIKYSDALAGSKPLAELTNSSSTSNGITTMLVERNEIPKWILSILIVLSGLVAILFVMWYTEKRWATTYKAKYLEQERCANELSTEAQNLRHQAYFNVDPSTVGEPMVQGGINDTTAVARFQDMAAERWLKNTGHAVDSDQFNIVRLVRGRGWGIISNRYRPNTWREVRYMGQTVYRATVETPDDYLETMWANMGCGNDLRIVTDQQASDNWRFVEDSVVTDTTADAETPTSAQAPQAVTTIPGTPTTQVMEPVEGLIARFELRRPTDGKPGMFRVTGLDGTTDLLGEVRDDGFTLRGGRPVGSSSI